MQNKASLSAEVVVIGAGTVGAAIAYGLALRKVRVLVLDGGDRDLRAARANFGLVWLQGKGSGLPAYQHLTRASIDLWPRFCAELRDGGEIDPQYDNQGGLSLCLSEQELHKREHTLLRLQNQLGAVDCDWEMLDREGLQRLFPGVRWGGDVAGASFGRRDGHTNPLRLLAALHTAIVRHGGRILSNCPVRTVQAEPGGHFTIQTQPLQISAVRVVIAAGLGSATLAAQIGLHVPIRPQRGQILVTERLAPLLPLPISGLRQTREGTIMIGATHEEVGLDIATTPAAAGSLSAAAIRRIPALRDVNVVRQWSGLRVMTPDTYPVYAQSAVCPGAFVALCHSGITLAAVHATLLSEAIAAGVLPASLQVFHPRRFDVPQDARAGQWPAHNLY